MSMISKYSNSYTKEKVCYTYL